MIDKFSLASYLSQFIINTNIRIPEIARRTGLPQESLYKWKNGTRPSDSKDIEILVAFMTTVDSLLFANAPATTKLIHRFEPDTPTMRLSLATAIESPVFNTGNKEGAGCIVIVDNEPQLIIERIDAFMGDAEGCIMVTGDTMRPTFNHGERAAIKRLSDPRSLYWGNFYYIIDTHHEGYIKRAYPHSEEAISLVSDNPDQDRYPPIIRRWDHILAICGVIGKLQKY